MFNNAFEAIIKHEGGYVNDPKDPGGETKFGISKRSYPDQDIAGLTITQAKIIYRRDFWEKIKGDRVKYYSVALPLFDMAVNAGVGTAVKMMQKVVGTTADGIVGNNTIAAINSFDPELLAALYRYERLKHYALIVSRNVNLVRFLKGWINRIETTN